MVLFKRISILFIMGITVVFIFLPDNSEAATYKAGDIFITKTSSAKGLTGHTGIAISSTEIAHTSGRSSEPYPTTISISEWNSRYPETKVIRPNSSSLGEEAAEKASHYFVGENIDYWITSNPKDIDPYTYCSELVWYSYYKAGKEFEVIGSNSNGLFWKTPGIIEPYDFTKSNYVEHNGFTFIDNSW
ncbi:hypothetical protein [Alteribacillus sp. HJP-4]|uniref:hypothetical protein n=1 Tax=Alteribacillus sp. HJP-4 TaxID=2775394 RepID=UPI0035CCFBCB